MRSGVTKESALGRGKGATEGLVGAGGLGAQVLGVLERARRGGGSVCGGVCVCGGRRGGGW